MAKLYELKYHEDRVEKHSITQEEIEFLTDLQKEMNTQDHVGQADPRYWTIKDYYKIYGDNLSNVDGVELYDTDSCETVCTIEYGFLDLYTEYKAIKEYFLEYHSDDFEEDDFKYIFEKSDLVRLLEEKGYEERYGFIEYQEVSTYNGVFLTHKAAAEHLKTNYYHYSSDAHTYALTAWRSNEEKLWEILQTVDWDKVELEKR